MAEIRYTATEAEFQQAVTQLAEWHGLKWWHDADSRRNKAGLPDLIIVGRQDPGEPPAVLWRELKTATGRVSRAQQAWLDWLRLAGADAAVWRPADLASGRVRREMEAIRVSGDPSIAGD